jgi:nicotinamidase-related amidase
LHQYLQDNEIEEVHIVGVDTSDCVLASAHESFDLGYFTFVIEECCQVAHDRTLHEKAVDILRFGKLTNNSCIEDIHSVTVDLV